MTQFENVIKTELAPWMKEQISKTESAMRSIAIRIEDIKINMSKEIPEIKNMSDEQVYNMTEEIGNKIKKELESMNNTLAIKGHCSTIDPARIHKLRTEIYNYIQETTGNTNPRFIERTEFAMKLQTIENKLILSCYEEKIKSR